MEVIIENPDFSPHTNPLMWPEVPKAIEEAMKDKAGLLACNKRDIRLLINEYLPNGKKLTRSCWDRLLSQDFSAAFAASDELQNVMDAIEQGFLNVKRGLFSDMIGSDNFFGLQKAMTIYNIKFKGESDREAKETSAVGNVTIVVNVPKDLPLPPSSEDELARLANAIE